MDKDHRKGKIYCSGSCKLQNHKSKYGKPETDNIHPGILGDVNELLVCADLLKKGYEVFRSISHTCSCDLIAMKDGMMIRVEVKSAYLKKNGKFSYAKGKNSYDLLALVLNYSSIHYLPYT